MVMGDITRIDTVQQYCDLFEVEALHPLVSVVNCYEVQPIRHSKKLYNIYAVLLKDTDCGTMNYGRSLYDYEKGSMLFIAPGQVMGSDDDGSLHQPAGWVDRCIRFYDRQFITRENANNDLLARFELLLNNYYHSALPTSKGIPTVQYCADQLCLSTNYFSDLVKKETGMSAIKHIQQKIMDIAKERIMNTQKSISQISDEMGFQYPQHFTRWFKKMEGCTPNEYRNEIIKQAIN